MIPIRLTITGRQMEHDSDPEEIRIRTEGKLYTRAHCHVITYQETEQSGLGRTLTTVKVHEDGQIDLLRAGESRTKMTFRAGERQMTEFQTPVGFLSIGLLTHAAEARIADDQGEVMIKYALDYSNQDPIDMTLELKYQALEHGHDTH